jgi:hypothetical protein
VSKGTAPELCCDKILKLAIAIIDPSVQFVLGAVASRGIFAQANLFNGFPTRMDRNVRCLVGTRALHIQTPYDSVHWYGGAPFKMTFLGQPIAPAKEEVFSEEDGQDPEEARRRSCRRPAVGLDCGVGRVDVAPSDLAFAAAAILGDEWKMDRGDAARFLGCLVPRESKIRKMDPSVFYALEGMRTERGSTVNSQQLGVLDENDARIMAEMSVDFGCSGSLRGTIFEMLQSCL